ncbi:MAG: PilZ domain-containing protein [Proteobacteria bacterium]|nr:PilZ domain-containing protein [Pseudomonadota bacterium]MBU1738847.1 PilZ domain-containing protein [Pseudomonadota bacterium]
MSVPKDTIKAVNQKNGIVSFTCPACNKEKNISLKRLAGRHKVKVKCSCQNRFPLAVDHRNRKRRKVEIPAFCEKTSGEETITLGTSSLNALNRSDAEKPRENNCMVVDLSREGIAIKTRKELGINEGDTIKVLFNLDDISGTEIYQDYKVKNVIKNRYGCSIIGSNIHLGFYSPVTE